MSGGTLPPAELAIVHAWLATRPNNRLEVRRCNAMMIRMRDLLQHGPSVAMTISGTTLSEAEFDAARPQALESLRARCRLCGQCAKRGIDPP
jgi:anti-sigma factor RsiW